jgi:hypothetical protein
MTLAVSYQRQSVIDQKTAMGGLFWVQNPIQ